MNYVCIIKVSNTVNKLVNSLKKLGFKHIPHYTTDKKVKSEDKLLLETITKERFEQLIKKKRLIKFEEVGKDILYGLQTPYGSSKYVSVVDLSEYNLLKERYGEQIIGVYIGNTSDNIDVDIIENDKKDVNRITADIIKFIRKEEKK